MCNKVTLLFFLILAGFSQVAVAQSEFFDNEERLELAKKTGDFIYNLEKDSADKYIQYFREEMPNHPILPIIEGIQLLWLHLPVLEDTVFNQFIAKMEEVVRFAEGLGDYRENTESLFFQLAARGLMAEYFADRSDYMKALGEANKAYKMVKLGFEKTDEINEFLFPTGLYNYFREKYPQVYPVYKPFVWIFKGGDQELGLQQLDRATRETVILRVEAHIYISYIYLRYEDTPEKAQEYLSFLVRQYPNNAYLLTKYLESLRGEEYLSNVSETSINQLVNHDRAYFQMAGYTFKGLYEEKVKGNSKKAFSHYAQAIEKGKDLPSHGEFYKSLSYLGMGRILSGDRPQTAQVYLTKALELAETKDVRKEARRLMK